MSVIRGEVAPVVKHHMMNVHMGHGGKSQRILYLGTGQGEWSVTAPAFFIPVKVLAADWIRG
jgi:hypothetical protein